MDYQVILNELIDLRAKGLDLQIYEHLVKMIEKGIVEPSIVFTYLDGCLANGVIKLDTYEVLIELFSDELGDDLDEVPFY